MKRLLLVLLLPMAAYAQNWSGILDTSRAVDWSTAGVTGGIPTRNTICSTLSPGATAGQINSALSGCPSGQVVFLSAGTYNLSNQVRISTNNVTLRGAGAASTILNFTSTNNSCSGSDSPICVTGASYNATGPPGPLGAPGSQVIGWSGTNGSSGTYTPGATVINLASTPTGLTNGYTLFLSQSDDANVNASALFVGGNCNSNPSMSLDGSSESHSTGQQQNVNVVGVSGTQVTISPGIYMANWRTGQTPQAYWLGGPITGVGIESLRVQTSAASDVGASINFLDAADSWVTAISATAPPFSARAVVRFFQSRHMTLSDSYLRSSAAGGALNYGIEVYDCSDCLVQNNILDNVTTPVMVAAGSEGSVIAYNYTIIAGSGAHDIQFHQEGNALNLVEGNVSNSIILDAFHGTNNLMTLFRNRVAGNGVTAIDDWADDRYLNVIGNVLGFSGYSTTYEKANPTLGFGAYGYAPNIYRWGYPYADDSTNYGAGDGRSGCGVYSINGDTQVHDTSMRWGNYDVVNGANRFVNAEVPTGIGSYANAVPGSQTLPASFYLNSKPAFFSASKPWPPIGPDVTGGNITGVGGHANTIPAQDCYGSLNGITNFDAITCYYSTSNVATPTFSPGGGVYFVPQSVTITTATGGATICYTTDGSIPTTNGAGTCTSGTTYTTPVVIGSATTLIAIASFSGRTDSGLALTNYAFPPPTIPSAAVFAGKGH